MKETTQKAIKEEIANGNALDITKYKFKKMNQLIKKECGFNIEAVSVGKYGTNGALFSGYNTGTRYAISKRTTALFMVV